MSDLPDWFLATMLALMWAGGFIVGWQVRAVKAWNRQRTLLNLLRAATAPPPTWEEETMRLCGGNKPLRRPARTRILSRGDWDAIDLAIAKQRMTETGSVPLSALEQIP